MYLAKIFAGDLPDRRTALEVANYRLINAQKQIALLSDLAEIKQPAQMPSADDAIVILNGLRSGIARINYLSGILSDANAALKDSLEEIARSDDLVLALTAENENLNSKIAQLQNDLSQKTAQLEMIHNSRSWRVTQILRFLNAFVARLKRRKAS